MANIIKLAIVLLLYIIVIFYQATLAASNSQSSVKMAVTWIPNESGPCTCLTAEQRKNTLKRIRGNVNGILNEQEIEITATVVPECGDGLWYRVAYLNMTDPLQQCPSVWREYNTNGVRACGRPASNRETCPSTVHSMRSSHSYSRVCGRVIGFQVGSPDGFNPTYARATMDGIIISHGTSQHHIWSYIAGATESSYSHVNSNCPCSSRAGHEPPPSIGDNYYCESGNPTNSIPFSKFYPSDPLWDSQQCEGTCCSDNKSPPWFSVQLPSNTTDRIEVRICPDEYTNNEDTPVQLLEIYVQ